jgi:hypothetical protein
MHVTPSNDAISSVLRWTDYERAVEAQDDTSDRPASYPLGPFQDIYSEYGRTCDESRNPDDF